MRFYSGSEFRYQEKMCGLLKVSRCHVPEGNRCEMFCKEMLNSHSISDSLPLLPCEQVPLTRTQTHTHTPTHFSLSHQLHLHTCIQTARADCHFPLDSVSPPLWPLFAFTPGHNNSSPLCLKTQLSVFMGYYTVTY